MLMLCWHIYPQKMFAADVSRQIGFHTPKENGFAMSLNITSGFCSIVSFKGNIIGNYLIKTKLKIKIKKSKR